MYLKSITSINDMKLSRISCFHNKSICLYLLTTKILLKEYLLLFHFMSQAIKDISAGAVSGWAQVIIMQPFEIIKVRLQTQDSKNP